MKYAVLSDVHSNLEALISVLSDLREKGISRAYFIGDAVGYGPDPEECVTVLRRECEVFLGGNHDYGVCGLTDVEFFNPYARAAIEWTAQVMRRESVDFLRGLGTVMEQEETGMTFVHSTPCRPLEWHYLFSAADAEANFPCFPGNCFVGHTHRPVIFERKPSGEISVCGTEVSLSPDCRYIVNTGSVGQPRDGDPRASYVVGGEGSFEIVRVPYNVRETQKKMAAAGLPEPLIDRLSLGR